MSIDITADRAIIDAATDGPWHIEHDCNDQAIINAGPEWIALLPHQCVESIRIQRENDAKFFVAARTGWPAALDECERLRVLLAEACREWSHASAPEWTETHSRIAEIRKEGGIK